MGFWGFCLLEFFSGLLVLGGVFLGCCFVVWGFLVGFGVFVCFFVVGLGFFFVLICFSFP